MTSLTQLRQEHGELVRIVRELEQLVSGETPAALTALYDVRRRLSTTLIAHLKAEDWVLYPPLLSDDDLEIVKLARSFVDEMGRLAQTFTVYMSRWDELSIQSDWPRHQAETLEIIEALRNRIIRENKELYPLLEGTRAA